MEDKNTKKPIRSALGRGLSSLISGTPVPVAPHRLNIPSSSQAAQSTSSVPMPTLTGNLASRVETENLAIQADDQGRVDYLKIDLLINNPKQPRQEFLQNELNELSDSIKNLGVLQPILVRPSKEVLGSYEIVAGERRWRASKLANLEQVPVIIQNLDDRQTLEISIVENVQREGLNPIEEATAYERLMLEFGLGQKEVAERVGKDRTSIANITRLLKLPSEVQEFVRNNKLSVGHAKAILTIKEPHAQISLAKKVINEELSVRALEAIVARVVVLDGSRNRKVSGKSNASKDLEFPEIIDRIRNTLGTKVNIIHKKSGANAGSGKIEIEYYSEQELERIVDAICKS